MKKLILMLMVMSIVIGTAGCGDKGEQRAEETAAKTEATEEAVEQPTMEPVAEEDAEAEADILVVNPSFEDELGGEWGFWQSEGGTYSVAEGGAAEGNKCVEIVNGADPFTSVWQTLYIADENGIDENDVISLQISIKGMADNQGQIKVMLEAVAADDTKSSLAEVFVNAENEEWEIVTTGAATVPEGTTAVNIVLENSVGGTIYIDDVKLMPAVLEENTDLGTATGYNIGNMGFEEITDWKTWVPSGDISSPTMSEDFAKSGSYSMMMNDKNSLWKEYNFAEADVPQIGSSAKIGSWIFVSDVPTVLKGDSEESYDFVVKLVGYTDEGNIKTVFTEKYLDVTAPINEWFYIETEIGEITDCDRIQFVFENNSGAVIYVDDVYVGE